MDMRKESIAGKWCVWECKWNTFCIWNWNWNWRYLCEICWWLPFADAVINSCTWHYHGKKGFKKVGKRCMSRYHAVCSRSVNLQAMCSITSLQHGDIFSIYLNYNTSKLPIYSQVFTGVKGDIHPVISPYSNHDKRDQNHFTLIN